MAQLSGTSISFGTRVAFHTGSTNDVNRVVYDSAAQKHVILYRDQDPSPNHGRIRVATISGIPCFRIQMNLLGQLQIFLLPVITYDPDQKEKLVIAYQLTQTTSQYGTARVYQTGLH